MTSAETLEAWIDAHDDHLPELKNFVLPSGNAASSALHIARTVRCREGGRVAERGPASQQGGSARPVGPAAHTYSRPQVCRRTERRVVELAQVDDVDESAKKFINRCVTIRVHRAWLLQRPSLTPPSSLPQAQRLSLHRREAGLPAVRRRGGHLPLRHAAQRKAISAPQGLARRVAAPVSPL